MNDFISPLGAEMKDFTIVTEYIKNNPDKESIVLTDEVGFSSQLLENPAFNSTV